MQLDISSAPGCRAQMDMTMAIEAPIWDMRPRGTQAQVPSPRIGTKMLGLNGDFPLDVTRM